MLNPKQSPISWCSICRVENLQYVSPKVSQKKTLLEVYCLFSSSNSQLLIFGRRSLRGSAVGNLLISMHLRWAGFTIRHNEQSMLCHLCFAISCAIQTVDHLRSMLTEGGFELRQRASGHPAMVARLPTEACSLATEHCNEWLPYM